MVSTRAKQEMTTKEKAKLRLKKQAELAEAQRRFYHRNWKAMSWCNKQGYTVYVSAQASNSDMVRIFKQKGEHFKPLNDKLYDQTKDEDMMLCTAAIDAEYERMFNLKK